MPTLVGLDRNAIQTLLETVTGAAVPLFRARQVYDAVYHQRVPDVSKITALPAAWRQKLAAIPFGLPVPVQDYRSVDGTRRYLLGLTDGKSVETVLMPEGERHTFCISSQVGCWDLGGNLRPGDAAAALCCCGGVTPPLPDACPGTKVGVGACTTGCPCAVTC